MIFDTSDIDDKIKADDYYLKLSNDGNMVEIKKKHQKTISQNAYLHVCISMVAIEQGLTLEETKQDLKRSCPFMHYSKNDKLYLRSSKLGRDEIGQFIEWIRNWASQKLNLNIMDSEEYKARRNEVDREIRKYRQFL